MSQTQRVPIATLPEGADFTYAGRRGTLVRIGRGSVTVRIQKPLIHRREFVPRTGRNAGKIVSVMDEYETITWAHAAPVTPITGGSN